VDICDAVKSRLADRRRRLARGPAVNLSHGAAKFRRLPRRAGNIFPRHILKREGSLDAVRGSVAAVSAMIELIAMAGVVSAFIFLTHAIDAYHGH
jgi:hypothetical protein